MTILVDCYILNSLLCKHVNIDNRDLSLNSEISNNKEKRKNQMTCMNLLLSIEQNLVYESKSFV
jgi:hypothetical protein